MQKSNFRQSIRAILVLIAICNVSYASEDVERGWFYYERPPQIESQPSPPPPEYKSYKQLLDEVKAEYDEIEAKAIINPTPENIKAYRQAMQLVSDKSAKVAMLAATQNWQDPNSRISLQATGGSGIQQDLDKARTENAEIIRKYGIFYFFAKDCKYCEVEASEIKRLEATYGIHVVAISMDGSTLPGFENALPDNGFSTNLGVSKPGALIAFDSTTRKAIPVGYGYLHFDEIMKRIQALFISGTAYTDEYIKSDMPVKIND
jgi:conjugal transfer pilus assembly protein TraF